MSFWSSIKDAVSFVPKLATGSLNSVISTIFSGAGSAGSQLVNSAGNSGLGGVLGQIFGGGILGGAPGAIPGAYPPVEQNPKNGFAFTMLLPIVLIIAIGGLIYKAFFSKKSWF